MAFSLARLYIAQLVQHFSVLNMIWLEIIIKAWLTFKDDMERSQNFG